MVNKNMVKQRRLNELPDEVVLKILSMIPPFKQSVAKGLISKQREDPYKLVPDVTFEDDNEESLVTFMSFIYGSLLSDGDQSLQRLHLKLVRYYSASKINFWVQVAVNRSVRKLKFDVYHETLELPRCLSSCTTLKSLILRDVYLDYVPLEFSLPSLKSLHLFSVGFSHQNPIARLLLSCPNLEYLVIYKTYYYYAENDNVSLYNINVPTLKSLTINNSIETRAAADNKENHGFWINAPALETLNIKDTVSNFLTLEFMPEVTKANIQVTCDQSEKFIGSLTSIKHLSLCSPTSETPYRSGFVFPYLEHLELCTCSPEWANLLASILNGAPRLQSLKLKSNHSAPSNDPKKFWETPAVVPECLLTHLEIFEWRQYEDTVQHRKVAAYILANATCLKMATFSTRSRDKDQLMPMQIKTLNRTSETCQLVFE
ncbi:putative FBD-associated F-box protein At5g56560 [Raphanus sativus]|uniref:FBD-associated F-box protein At5g56560 n=1 Tax=Raphanus sativus TaxID=3726 RepID=A0A6J0L7K0_RAPSA|nr:putative FBD-associated F-box protein At5g56560 [Raphanus sativus]